MKKAKKLVKTAFILESILVRQLPLLAAAIGMRNLIILRLGCFGHKPIVNAAQEKFSNYMLGREKLPVDLQSAIYQTVASNSNSETFQKLLKIFRKCDLHEEKYNCMAAMGSISHVEGLKKVLEFSLTPEFRRQDMFGVLGSTARNPYGLKLAWNFFKENYDILNERYSKFIGHFAKNITQNFYSIDKLIF